MWKEDENRFLLMSTGRDDLSSGVGFRSVGIVIEGAAEFFRIERWCPGTGNVRWSRSSKAEEVFDSNDRSTTYEVDES